MNNGEPPTPESSDSSQPQRKPWSVPLGELYATTNAANQIPNHVMLLAIARHCSGDWGEVCEDDWQANDEATGGLIKGFNDDDHNILFRRRAGETQSVGHLDIREDEKTAMVPKILLKAFQPSPIAFRLNSLTLLVSGPSVRSESSANSVLVPPKPPS